MHELLIDFGYLTEEDRVTLENVLHTESIRLLHTAGSTASTCRSLLSLEEDWGTVSTVITIGKGEVRVKAIWESSRPCIRERGRNRAQCRTPVTKIAPTFKQLVNT